MSVCVPLMSRWSLTLKTFVSWCKWCVGVVYVQSVIIFSVLFCMVCRVLWCVSVRLEAQQGSRRPSLYTVVVVSLLFPNVVLASDLRALSFCMHFIFMFVMYCLNDMDV